MSLPLAAFSASTALPMACWAEPLASLASAIPAWALLSTASMRTSLCWTRAWVFSTSAATASTFLLTSPTSRCTYVFFAQPERATPATSTGMTSSLTGSLLGSIAGDPAPGLLKLSSGRGNVSAAGTDDNPLAGGAHLEPAEPGGPRGGIIPQPVLMLELGRNPVRGQGEPDDVAHLERGPAGEGGVARENGAPLGGRPRLLLPHEEGRSGVVQGRDHGNRVDRDVEGP